MKAILESGGVSLNGLSEFQKNEVLNEFNLILETVGVSRNMDHFKKQMSERIWLYFAWEYGPKKSVIRQIRWIKPSILIEIV